MGEGSVGGGSPGGVLTKRRTDSPIRSRDYKYYQFTTGNHTRQSRNNTATKFRDTANFLVELKKKSSILKKKNSSGASSASSRRGGGRGRGARQAPPRAGAWCCSGRPYRLAMRGWSRRRCRRRTARRRRWRRGAAQPRREGLHGVARYSISACARWVLATSVQSIRRRCPGLVCSQMREEADR